MPSRSVGKYRRGLGDGKCRAKGLDLALGEQLMMMPCRNVGTCVFCKGRKILRLNENGVFWLWAVHGHMSAGGVHGKRIRAKCTENGYVLVVFCGFYSLQTAAAS